MKFETNIILILIPGQHLESLTPKLCDGQPNRMRSTFCHLLGTLELNNNWTVKDAAELYNIDRWGCGFFEIATNGQLTVQTKNGDKTSIYDAITYAENEFGIHPPFIVRFPYLIQARLRQINESFAEAVSQFSYQGRYRCFFPAKVNQHRDVIQAAIQYGREYEGGIEVGSKAELLAVLMMTDNTVPILCNGFKDAAVIEMAFRGMQLGRDVTIIIEKVSDLSLILETSTRLNLRPKLGIRIKLAAQSGGRWNASGGTKSKFGLSVSQLLNAIEHLKRNELLDCLYLLHFHPGSQISNVKKIKSSIVEAARIYCDLVKSGVPLSTLDVGGGLAIDYTGERSVAASSKNYSLQEYANDVIYYVQQVCRDSNVTQPDIISESGRAIAAHHSLLVIPILENHSFSSLVVTDSDLELCHHSNVLQELKLIKDSLAPNNLSESFHDAQVAIEMVWQMFSLGSLNLMQRSCAERLFGSICQTIANQLGKLDFVPEELEQLRHFLADTYIGNFSLFQGVPDAWALNQVFPVIPLHRLNEKPNCRAVIGDITCDSDGQIDCFIGSDGGKNSLPLHELTDSPYYIGICLIGAYQEALSDDHNLMGNFHVITVREDQTLEARSGASALDVLLHVDHCADELARCLDNSIKNAANCTHEQKLEIRAIFESVMQSYTYLEPIIDIDDAPSNQNRIDPGKTVQFSPSGGKNVAQVVSDTET